MKTIITIGIILFCRIAFAQDAAEKANMLQNMQQQRQIEDSANKADLKYLKLNYKGKLAAGPILMALGITGIGGGIYIKRNPNFNASDYINGKGVFDINKFNSAIKRHKTKYSMVIFSGSVFSALGIITTAFGIHNKTIYLDKKKEITMGLADENMGLAIRF